MKRDLAFLDLLRIIAALAISCFLHFKDHLIPAFGVEMPFSDNWPITWLASRSATFVELFFVISGLLFALFHLQKIRTGEYSFQRFFQKRALRLYPMVIVTTLYIYVIQNVLYWGTGETWSVSGTVKLWPALRAMLSCGWPAGGPNGPTWYTSVLLICTLLAFPLAKLYDRFRFAFVIPVVIGAICPYDPGGTFKCARGLAGFFVGVGLGILMQRLEEASQDRTGQDRTGQDRTGQDRICFTCTVISVFLGILVFSRDLYPVVVGGDWHMFGSFLLWPPVIVAGYLSPGLGRLCDNAVVHYLGKISFGIYLWNFPILATICLLDRLDIMCFDVTQPYFLVVLIAVHLAVGVISYECIEKRITRKLMRTPGLHG